MAEFRIRAFGFHRMEKEKQRLAREIGWIIYQSGFGDRKVKNKEQFWPLENKTMPEGMLEALKKAREDKDKILSGKS